jgi:hypothetical protein
VKTQSVVVEKGKLPVVFSMSPDSPAAPYIVEHRPSSLEDMYALGIIPASIAIAHLLEARDVARRVSMPHGTFADEQGRWYADRPIPGLTTLSRKSAMTHEGIRRVADHLERRGYDRAESVLTAQKAAYFIARDQIEVPVWRVVQLADRDLDVHGILVVDRSIQEVASRIVTFHKHGWIVPQGSHFLLTCREVKGAPDDPLYIPRVAQRVAARPVPGPPIEGWDDRLPIHEIHRLAGQVTRSWR